MIAAEATAIAKVIAEMVNKALDRGRKTPKSPAINGRHPHTMAAIAVI